MAELGWFRDQSIGQNGILSCSAQHPNTGLQSPSSVHRKGFPSAKITQESRINGARADHVFDNLSNTLGLVRQLISQ
jgi:hypothetical protein